MRRTNFCNVGVRGETKIELEKLRERLSQEYVPNATYDDLIKIFLEKNKKINLTEIELKKLLFKSRGVKW